LSILVTPKIWKCDACGKKAKEFDAHGEQWRQTVLLTPPNPSSGRQERIAHYETCSWPCRRILLTRQIDAEGDEP